MTTTGHLTEPLWAETGAVAAVDVDDAAAFSATVMELLRRDDVRLGLGLRGQRVYAEQFSVTRVVDTLRAA